MIRRADRHNCASVRRLGDELDCSTRRRELRPLRAARGTCTPAVSHRARSALWRQSRDYPPFGAAVGSVAVTVEAIRKDRSVVSVKPAGVCLRRIASGAMRRPCLCLGRSPKGWPRASGSARAPVLNDVVSPRSTKRQLLSGPARLFISSGTGSASCWWSGWSSPSGVPDRALSPGCSDPFGDQVGVDWIRHYCERRGCPPARSGSERTCTAWACVSGRWPWPP